MVDKSAGYNLPTMEDLQRRMGVAQPQSQGILSQAANVGSGLLSGAGQIGSGLLGGVGQFAGDVGRAVAPVAPQIAQNIADLYIQTEMQRASQPQLALDPAQLRPVSPLAAVGQIQARRKEEEAERQKRAIDLMRAAGSGSSGIVSAKTYRLPTGEIVETFADKNTLQRVYLDEQGNRKRVPVGAIEYSRADVQRSGYFDKKLADIRTDERRIKALDSYLNSVEGSEQGFKRFFDRLEASVKTFIDNGELTKQELSTAEGQAKLQGLLGMFREDIVGGGVMTEFDAIRVIRALGGNFDSLQNKELVRRIISDLRQQSIPRYQSNVEIYNSQLAQVPAGAATANVYKPHTPLSFTRQPPSVSDSTTSSDPLGIRQ
jgi:hypothetical protein